MSKLINEIIKVNSCENCPFRDFQDEMLTSSCKVGEEGLYFDQKSEKLLYEHKPYLHPKCPLKKGKIMVELIKE